MKRWIIGITGASGSVYAARLVEELVGQDCEIHVVASANGLQVFAYEMGMSLDGFVQSLPSIRGQIRMHDNGDMFAPIASGSFKTDGMAIVPCSMATAAEIHCGFAKTLLGRAADVCLKERRPLVLVPRETPLNSIHLRNLLGLSETGAIILPAMPGFYGKPETVSQLVDSITGRILDALGIENRLYPHWGENIKEEPK